MAHSKLRFVMALLLASAWLGPRVHAEDEKPKPYAATEDYHRIVGAAECQKCHAQHYDVWKQTRHYRTFIQEEGSPLPPLHRRPRAKEIAERLGLDSITRNSTCWGCHYTTQEVEGTVKPTAGISCEQCHGGAKDWLTKHYDYGRRGKDREPDAHKKERFESTAEQGMIWPSQVYAIISNCYDCHSIPNEELVNKGGHPDSSDFEIISYLNGEVRHSFYNDSKQNLEMSQNRKRLFYVTGQCVELECNMRGTGKATRKDVFGISHALRVQAVYERLVKINAALKLPEIDEMLAAVPKKPGGGLKMKINEQKELDDAADKVRAAILKMLQKHDGSQLAAADPFIPGPEKAKGGYQKTAPVPFEVYPGPAPWYVRGLAAAPKETAQPNDPKETKEPVETKTVAQPSETKTPVETKTVAQPNETKEPVEVKGPEIATGPEVKPEDPKRTTQTPLAVAPATGPRPAGFNAPRADWTKPAEAVFCPVCGRKNELTWEFCPHCGTKQPKLK